ncbi:MAG: hypothetical protein ACXQTM_05025 [Methanosarcinales archaeon]
MHYNLDYVRDEIKRTKSEIQDLRRVLLTMYDLSPSGVGKLDSDFKDEYQPVLDEINDLKAHLHYATDCLEVFTKLADGRDTFEVQNVKHIQGKINNATDRMIAMKQTGLLDSDTEAKFKAEIEEYNTRLKEAEKLENVVAEYEEFYQQCYRLSHNSHAVRSKLYRR